MSENESNESVVSTGKEVSSTSVTTPKTGAGKYIGAVLIVSVIILGVLFLMEKEGRSSTNLFTSVINNTAVAKVNGEKITSAELAASVAQFKQMAAAQGADVTASEAQAQIRSQALDVLINTALLMQKATNQGLSVSDEEVMERLDAIKVDVGGEEILAQRMAELGIDEDKLQQDIKDELLIQKLLDSVFAEKNIEITDEEIQQAYDAAGGEEAGLPVLEEVRSDVEAQLRSEKEQEAVNELLTEIKDGADINIFVDEEVDTVDVDSVTPTTE